MKLMGYEIYSDGLENLDLDKKQIINTLNPHSYVTAKYDPLFKKALRSSDVIIPDGSGILLASKVINGKPLKKISGDDLHRFVLCQINEKSGKVFYLGASESTLKKIESRIQNEYPNIEVCSYSPPFKENFSYDDNCEIQKRVNEFRPDALFIGMTAPKQEKWLFENKEHLSFTTAHCIGAVFDFYAGTVERPSQLWIGLHLEWLGRMIKEPRRMWKRNFVSAPLFLFDVFMEKVGFR